MISFDLLARESRRRLFPEQTSPVNSERLPVGSWLSTSIEVKERSSHDSFDDRVMAWVLQASPVLGPLLCVGLPVLAHASILTFLGLAVLAVLLVHVIAGNRLTSAQFTVMSVIGFANTVTIWFFVVSAGLALFLSFRAVSVFLLTFLGGLYVLRLGVDVLRTYVNWLWADPRLPSSSLKQKELHLNSNAVLWLVWAAAVFWIFAAWIADAITLVPKLAELLRTVSPFLLIVIPIGNAVIAPLPLAAFFWPFLFYDGGKAHVPGIHRPLEPLASRRADFRWAGVLFYAWVVVMVQALHPNNVATTTADKLAVRTFEAAAAQIKRTVQPPENVISEPAETDSTLSRLGGAVTTSLGFIAESGRIAFELGALAFFGIWAVTLPNRIYLGLLGRKVERLRSVENPWDEYVSRIQSSRKAFFDPLGGPLVKENEHLFVGFETTMGFPVLLPKALFHEHAYIVGDSGSGKTALGVMPLLMQLIRSGTEGEKHPLVIIDLKGDSALFHTVRIEAEKAGRDFRFFRPERGASTYHFNPIQDLAAGTTTSEMQICQLLLDSLGLNHGEGYGRGYYSKRSRTLLLRAMTALPGASGDESGRPTTLEELAERLEEEAAKDPRAATDAFELLATIEMLARYPTLGRPTAPENTIHMPDVLSQAQIVYFWLPAVVESMSAREIGKMALYSLVRAAIERDSLGQSKRQAFVFIDEFQRLAGENFKVILEQARSFGIGVVLANQSLDDLKTPSGDLTSTVSANTRVKMYFSVTNQREVEMLSSMFGQAPAVTQAYRAAVSGGPLPYVGDTYEEGYSTALTRPLRSEADIRRISDHPLRMVLHVSRGSGLAQFAGMPISLETLYSLDSKEYAARASMGRSQLLPRPSASPKPPEPRETEGPKFDFAEMFGGIAEPQTPLSNDPVKNSAKDLGEDLPIFDADPADIENSVTANLYERLRNLDLRGTDLSDEDDEPPVMKKNRRKRARKNKAQSDGAPEEE